MGLLKHGLLTRLSLPLTASRVIIPFLMRPSPVTTEASSSACTHPDHHLRVNHHRTVLKSGPQGIPTEYYSLLADLGDHPNTLKWPPTLTGRTLVM